MHLSHTGNEPLHYTLKIESFSILSRDPSIKIESDIFEAAGHKWRLDLHPNGDGIDRYISLYLVICDTESLLKGWNVRVDVKFYVYNHTHHSYMTFHDIDGNRTRFHEKQIKWGFTRLLSLESFKKSSNGYILNDSCVFGAEVFAIPQFTLKDRCLSMISPPATMNTYSWIVDNFSALTEKPLSSEVFRVGNVKWTLSLYPKGHAGEEGSSLSIFLAIHEPALFPDGWRVYANFKLKVKNQSGNADVVKETCHWFCKSTVDWGFSSFMPLSILAHTNKGFLVDDRVIVEAKISIIGMLRNFI